VAWKLTINGVDKTSLVVLASGVMIDWPLNGRASARFTCAPGLLPAPLDEVVIYAQDGVTPIFGGVVLPTGRSVSGRTRGNHGLVTQVQCGDYATYADWCYTAEDAGSPTPITMKAILQGVVTDYLSRYGITLDPAQVTGPTINAFERSTIRLSDILRELAEYTGYVWRISPTKVLSMFQSGSTSAPYTLTDAAPHSLDVSWADNSQTEAPANTVIVLYGPPGTVTSDEAFAGNGVTTSWVTAIADVVPTDRVTITPSGGAEVEYTISGGAFTWSQATHTLTRGTAPIPATGETLRLYYQVTFPQRVSATTGATPIIEAVHTKTDVLTPAEALVFANALLAKTSQPALDLSILTLDHGFWPGQALTVDLTARGLDVAAVITAVSARLVTDVRWEYTVQATGASVVPDSAFRGSYLDQWRTLLGTSGGRAPSAVSGSVVTPVVMSSPFPLATSRNMSVPCGTTPTPAQDFITYEATVTFGAVVRVECKARQAGVGVTPSLWDVTAGSAAATGSKVTSQAWVSQDIAVTLTAGHQYYLRVVTDDAAGSAYAVGKLVA
jgi:hypothetical protein